jgi:hypothetical protein
VTAPAWPRQGRCGACGRPAREFPSLRWEHVGRPCRLRSQDMWTVDDYLLRGAVRFVPEGEPLPEGPQRWHLHREGREQVGLCRISHTHSIREFLARDAEEGVR